MDFFWLSTPLLAEIIIRQAIFQRRRAQTGRVKHINKHVDHVIRGSLVLQTNSLTSGFVSVGESDVSYPAHSA